jgi:hypothetical protein
MIFTLETERTQVCVVAGKRITERERESSWNEKGEVSKNGWWKKQQIEGNFDLKLKLMERKLRNLPKWDSDFSWLFCGL